MINKINGKIKAFFTALYIKLFRINDTPQRIALGFGIGIFLGILPGTGPIAALTVALILRVNRASALIGSLISNTWVSLLTFILAVKLGSSMFGVQWQQVLQESAGFFEKFSWQGLFSLSLTRVFLPIIAGYLVISFLLGLVSYLIILPLLSKAKALKALLAVMVSLQLISCACVPKEDLFLEAEAQAKAHKYDFAFILLGDYLKNNPGGRRGADARFALAEYYYLRKNYRPASVELTKYFQDYHDAPSAIFAKAMLYKILQEKEEHIEITDKLKQDFFSRPLFLVFSQSHAASYVSALNNTYKIMDYVDKIEVYLNDEIFLEIRP